MTTTANAKIKPCNSPRQHVVFRTSSKTRLQHSLTCLHPKEPVLLCRRLGSAQYAGYGEVRGAARRLLRRGRALGCLLHFRLIPVPAGLNHREAGNARRLQQPEAVRLRGGVPAARLRAGHDVDFDGVGLGTHLGTATVTTCHTRSSSVNKQMAT